MTQIIVNLPWVKSTKESISGTTDRMKADSEDAVSRQRARGRQRVDRLHAEVGRAARRARRVPARRGGPLPGDLRRVPMTDKQLAEATQGEADDHLADDLRGRPASEGRCPASSPGPVTPSSGCARMRSPSSTSFETSATRRSSRATSTTPQERWSRSCCRTPTTGSTTFPASPARRGVLLQPLRPPGRTARGGRRSARSSTDGVGPQEPTGRTAQPAPVADRRIADADR